MSEMVIATADICPHGVSSSLCEWCIARATSANRLKIIESLQSRIAKLEKVVEAARETILGNPLITSDRFIDIRRAIAELDAGEK